MKLYNKIGMFALAVATLSSCSVNDPFADNMELGQVIPTVSWELGSAICKAGNDASFKGKYYFDGTDMTSENIDHSEVWALITRNESAAATCKLTTSYSYTQTVALTDTARSEQIMKKFEHKSLTWNAAKTIADFNKVYVEDEAEWQGNWKDEDGKMYNSDYHIDRSNGYEYILTGSFPTSKTLAPISWVNPQSWDQEKFDQLYPDDFQANFVTNVITALTKDSLYYNDLRHVYVNYDFKAEQIQALNAKHNVAFPTEIETGLKSDLWFSNVEKVVGKYWIVIDANGKKIIHETTADGAGAPEGANLYDVYDSSPWVFCRYSDDIGAVMTSVRAAWMPFFVDLLTEIPFIDWIYDSANQNYAVNFARDYELYPRFKVYGTNGKVGFSTDQKKIAIN
ncbi:MAG: hypothetical protein PHR45_03475 [Muribaculaceae bacterium]|nr:hypothetical protein [Muribaculaceae bacterium]